MARFVKGDIVVIKFPFSDTENSKKRPALVAANPTDDNLILCQITSKKRSDPDIIPIRKKDFQNGSLNRNSFTRPTILFTVHKSKVDYKAGHLKRDKIKSIEKRFCKVFAR